MKNRIGTIAVAIVLASVAVGSEETETEKQIENIIPILAVEDVEASIAHYENVLGFEQDWVGGNFGQVSRDGWRVYLSETQGQPGAYLWIGVQDVDVIHAEYVESGADIVHPPEDVGHSLEMRVRDLDGNVLRFGS